MDYYSSFVTPTIEQNVRRGNYAFERLTVETTNIQIIFANKTNVVQTKENRSRLEREDDGK